MAIKHLCDRCGAEINPAASGRYCALTDKPYEPAHYPTELCVSCTMQLQEWLKTRPVCVIHGRERKTDG